MLDLADNSDAYFLERNILSPRNDHVNDINHSVLEKFPGEESICHSAEVVSAEGDYPTEFVNTINPSAMPLSKLHVKKGW